MVCIIEGFPYNLIIIIIIIISLFKFDQDNLLFLKI